MHRLAARRMAPVDSAIQNADGRMFGQFRTIIKLTESKRAHNVDDGGAAAEDVPLDCKQT